MITSSIAAGLAMFMFVFMRAFQQRNVQGLHYAWIIPTSLSMAIFEVYVVASVAKLGYSLPLVLSVGFFAGVGCMCAMFLHNKYLTRR